MKNFNVSLVLMVTGTVTVQVPDELTLDEAIQWAKDNLDSIPNPDLHDCSYISDSEQIDEDNCDFDE